LAAIYDGGWSLRSVFLNTSALLCNTSLYMHVALCNHRYLLFVTLTLLYYTFYGLLAVVLSPSIQVGSVIGCIYGWVLPSVNRSAYQFMVWIVRGACFLSVMLLSTVLSPR
jgi:hypothetical protein